MYLISVWWEVERSGHVTRTAKTSKATLAVEQRVTAHDGAEQMLNECVYCHCVLTHIRSAVGEERERERETEIQYRSESLSGCRSR